jgi:SAM-dependent methyltransferase
MPEDVSPTPPRQRAQSHRWRTAANSAGYLLPYLHPGGSLLDVGCGPGTITADLGAAVAPGRVVAIDRSADVLEEARSACARRRRTARRRLRPRPRRRRVQRHPRPPGAPTPHRPVAALAEMRRVTRPGGWSRPGTPTTARSPGGRSCRAGRVARPLPPGRPVERGRARCRPAAAGLGARRGLHGRVGRRLGLVLRLAGRPGVVVAELGGSSHIVRLRGAGTGPRPRHRCRPRPDRRRLAGVGRHPDGWLVLVHGEVLATR